MKQQLPRIQSCDYVIDSSKAPFKAGVDAAGRLPWAVGTVQVRLAPVVLLEDGKIPRHTHLIKPYINHQEVLGEDARQLPATRVHWLLPLAENLFRCNLLQLVWCSSLVQYLRTVVAIRRPQSCLEQLPLQVTQQHRCPVQAKPASPTLITSHMCLQGKVYSRT